VKKYSDLFADSIPWSVKFIAKIHQTRNISRVDINSNFVIITVLMRYNFIVM